MIRKPFLWYLQYLFWAQMIASLLSLLLFCLSESTTIPVISRAELPDTPTGFQLITTPRLTGELLVAEAVWYERLLLTQLGYAPLRDAGMALASLAFSIVMLLFFRNLKKGQRFSRALVQHLRWGAWVLMGYMALDVLLHGWRWQLVEQLTNKQYLPLYKLEHLRPVLLMSMLLLVVAVLLQKAKQLDEEQALTI